MTINTNSMLARLETASEKTAKALVRRSDIRVVARGTEAHFNWTTKTLVVPAYSIREDALPEHVNAWRGILDHECAHVEFSEGPVYDRFIAAWQENEGNDVAGRLMKLANVFEDFMIERRWKEHNPGSVKHLKACADLVIRETGGAKCCDPDYQPEGSPKPVGFFMALIQAMLRVNSGHVAISEVHPAIAMVLDYCDDEIVVGLAAPDSESVCLAAEAVWAKLKDLQSLMPPPPQPGEGEGEDGQQPGEGEQGEGDSEGSEQSERDSDGSEGEGDNESEGEGDESEGEGEGSEGEGSEGEGDESGSEGKNKGKGDSKGDNESKGEGDSSGGTEGDESEGGDKTRTRNEGEGAGYAEISEPSQVIEAADSCCGGEYGEIKTASEVVAGLFLGEADNRPYTIHPQTSQDDKWERYDSNQRSQSRANAIALRAAAGPAITTMANLLRCAVKAQKQTLWVGGLEEGADLDPDGLPGLASGSSDTRIFMDQFNQLDENTFVQVLVDCSGSMGDSTPIRKCPKHGTVSQKGDVCSRKNSFGGKRCNEALTWEVNTKAGYAAMTATVLHDALRLCGVQHSVLGYTNSWSSNHGDQEKVEYRNASGGVSAYPKWSRCRTSLWMHEFVPAPGISDDGGALPYITGYNANLDGESVIAAAKYAVEHGSKCDRIVMIVIADGLPAGADDHELEGRYLRDSVEKIAQAGIEVYGIGVGIGYQRASYKEYYPNKPALGRRAATGHVLIQSGVGLSNAVMKQLTNLLVRSNGRGR